MPSWFKMFKGFAWHTPVVIDRGMLRKLISRQCDDQDFVPLDMEYTLVPDKAWLVKRTPHYSRHRRDCNQRACLAMAQMQECCVGMCVIGTSDKMIDHCVNIVAMEGGKIMLYDPSLLSLRPASVFDVKRIWL